jgi:hypothetical protein
MTDKVAVRGDVKAAPTAVAPSFRVLCERVGSTDLTFHGKTYVGHKWASPNVFLQEHNVMTRSA